MRRHGTLFRILALVLAAAVLAILVLPGLALADWQSMDPPPDADKPADGSRSLTCWQATAANMLAAAGYGDGASVQDRAEDIYNEMFEHFGNEYGWIDTALDWWLWSSDNTWKSSNPYIDVTVYGNKDPMYPWRFVLGPWFIGHELRDDELVGLSISWPEAGAAVGRGGHAFTAWGDSGDDVLTGNPAEVICTDSDTDIGGDVQTYSYDAYTNPNPGGSNEGSGWYIDYSAAHPYIKHITTLSKVDYLPVIPYFDFCATAKAVGSIQIDQANDEVPATDLHYEVYADVDILLYRTAIEWATSNSPNIVEGTDGNWHWIKVDWNLEDNPVPYGAIVTITTEFVEPCYNAIYHENSYFTYPPPEPPAPFAPSLGWNITTPVLADIDLPNISGGYVVGGFEIFADPAGDDFIGSYRLLHEYNYYQDPELHYFSLEAANETAYVGGLRFGHSYGFLEGEELWAFDDWMTEDYEIREVHQYEPVTVDLDWEGLLPYPLGDGPDCRLTVDSTEGGSVTTPGEGVFGYDEGEVVDLEATPDRDYRFDGWTGDVGTITAVGSANTTITMNGDYEITAYFKLKGCPGVGSLADVLPFTLVSMGIVVTWATKRRGKGS